MKIALIAIAFLMSGVFSQRVFANANPYFDGEPQGLTGSNPQGKTNPNAFGLGFGDFLFQDGLYRVDGTDVFLGGQQQSQFAQNFGALARDNVVHP